MSGEDIFEVRRFDQLGSTNTHLLEQARAGAPEGTVVVADHQSAGRGRLGRRWEAPPGTCLLVSVLLRPVTGPEERPLATTAVALAAVEACQVVAGVSPDVKWPNDLVVADRKLAGVLAEADPGAGGGPEGSVAVVVGLGLNIEWPGPPGVGGTCLAHLTGRSLDRDRLLDAWLCALAPRVVALRSADGRLDLAQELRERCSTLGRPVRVELVDGSVVEGTATGLSDGGHLVVGTASGPVVITAGDVIHLRPNGSTQGGG